MNADGFGSEGLEFAVSVIQGIKPNDQLEVMLAAQMALMHMTTMKNAQRLGMAEAGSPSEDSAVRTVTKLSRTYTALMEVLKRYRTGGEQKVTVQHVSVSEGGQAIVGHVTQNALGMPAEETPSLPASRQRIDPETLEDLAIAGRDWVAEREKAALTDSSQPEVAFPDESQGKLARVPRKGKRRGRRSSVETTILDCYRLTEMPPVDKPRSKSTPDRRRRRNIGR